MKDTTATNANKRHMKPEEIGEAIGLGKSKVYEMLNSGAIPNIRAGKRFIVPSAAFDRWLETCGGKLTAPATEKELQTA